MSMETTGRQVWNLVSLNSDNLYSYSISINFYMLINFPYILTQVAYTL